MPSIVRRIWKWIAATLAGLLILLAVGVGIFRFMVQMAPEWRADVEAVAERALGWPVRIGEIDLRWALLGPELVLADVQVLSPDSREPIAVAERIDVAFGPKDLLQGQALRPGHVRIHRPSFALERDAGGTLYLSGYALPTDRGSRVEWREILDATLRHGRLTVIEGEMRYRDPAREIAEWVLLLPRVSLASDGRRHELEGSIVPPGALGEHLEFNFQAEGLPAEPEHWRWTATLGARDLHLQWWYQQFPWAGGGRLTGTVDLDARIYGRGTDAWSGRGSLQVDELGLLPAAPVVGESSAYYEHIAFDWHVVRGDTSLLELAAIEMRHAGRLFEQGRFTLSHDAADEFPLQITANRVPLEEVQRLARFLPVDEAAGAMAREARERILQFAPHGMLKAFVLDFDPAARPARFRIASEFEDLGISQWQQMPGFTGLSGSVRGDHLGGRLRLDSIDVAIDTGGMFRTALPVRRLNGELDWSRDEQGWRLRGEELEVENPEAQAIATLDLMLPFDGPVWIDLAATARNADFHARSTWLPVGIMSDALVDWLDNAVLDGRAPEATLLLRGPLKNFPYRDGSGIFDIRFLAQDVAVEYAPGWPAVQKLSANVRFFGPSLDIHIHEATVMDALKVTRGEAHLSDLQDPSLQLRADVEGDLADGWRFVEDSPLAETLSGLLNALQVEGPMQASVEIQLPLDDADKLDLNIDTDIRDASVQVNALPWPVTELAGRVRIGRHEIRAEQLDGLFHGHPLRMAIAPENDTADAAAEFSTTRIALQGRSGVERFSDYVPPTWLARLEGDFAWAGELRVPVGENITINIASDMADVGTRLPAPLHVTRGLQASLTLADAERIDAHVQLDDTAAARLRFVDGPGGWIFDRGRVQLGEQEAGPLPAATGLQIAGQTPILDIGGWLALDEHAEEAAAPLLQAFDVRAEQLQFAGMTLEQQAMRGSRKAGGWEILLDGPAAQGTIVVPGARPHDPPGGRPLQATLARLHLPLPESEATDEDAVSLDPRDLPGVIIAIDDFRFGGVDLGRVSGTLDRTAIGYSTDALRVSAGSFDLVLSGRWEFVAGQHYTSLTGTLESRNLEDTLRRLGYEAGVSARNAQASLSLAWPGSPISPDPSALEGSLGFDIRDGALREVNPGAGRLLGLLSITALPRRLFLDFTDFLGEGLHFDTIKGDFVITQGNAYTTNTRLRGPSLSAVLVGRTGIAERDYDQLAIVNPGVSASLPVAGYLAAGPQVGAALLLLSQLLKAPLADITQVKYRITGGWDEPVIERVVPERERQNATNN